MIQGFEDYTQPLTKDELYVLNGVITGLLSHRGKANAVTSGAIIKGIAAYYGVQLTGPRVRKIINHIRVNDLLRGEILCANSNGYYVADNRQEAEENILGLRGRLDAIQAVYDNLTRQINNKFN